MQSTVLLAWYKQNGDILTTSIAGNVIITVVTKLLHKPKMSARLAPSGSLV